MNEHSEPDEHSGAIEASAEQTAEEALNAAFDRHETEEDDDRRTLVPGEDTVIDPKATMYKSPEGTRILAAVDLGTNPHEKNDRGDTIMAKRLLVMHDPHEGYMLAGQGPNGQSEFLLIAPSEDWTRIGRRPENNGEVFSMPMSVSAGHIEVRVDNEGVFHIRDIYSTNGTRMREGEPEKAPYVARHASAEEDELEPTIPAAAEEAPEILHVETPAVAEHVEEALAGGVEDVPAKIEEEPAGPEVITPTDDEIFASPDSLLATLHDASVDPAIRQQLLLAVGVWGERGTAANVGDVWVQVRRQVEGVTENTYSAHAEQVELTRLNQEFNASMGLLLTTLYETPNEYDWVMRRFNETIGLGESLTQTLSNSHQAEAVRASAMRVMAQNQEYEDQINRALRPHDPLADTDSLEKLIAHRNPDESIGTFVARLQSEREDDQDIRQYQVRRDGLESLVRLANHQSYTREDLAGVARRIENDMLDRLRTLGANTNNYFIGHGHPEASNPALAARNEIEAGFYNSSIIKRLADELGDLDHVIAILRNQSEQVR